LLRRTFIGHAASRVSACAKSGPHKVDRPRMASRGTFQAPVSVPFRIEGELDCKANSDDGETYEGVICHACGRQHLVNPKTGKTAGVEDK
jgi:hypothetical protein